MKKSWMHLVFGFSIGMTGCGAGLTYVQKNELKNYQLSGVEVKEKDPGVGAVLGILPGGGSFYTRQPALGVVNLLLWPLSILWDTVNGYQSSERINYDATRVSVNKDRQAAMRSLDNDLLLKKLSMEEYVIKKREIEGKYSAEGN